MWPRSRNVFAFRRRPYWSRLTAGATGGWVDLGGREPYLKESRIDILYAQLYYIFIRAVDGSCWGVLGGLLMIDGSRLAIQAQKRLKSSDRLCEMVM